jgi:primosomal protein N' (replication factor Y)
MQAAGRAGRGEKPGRVVLQTYNPDHYAIVAAAKHDYEKFYQEEISQRRALGYPPFLGLLKITAQSPQENEAKAKILLTTEALQKALVKLPRTVVIGPFPAATYKVKNIYRMNLLIKTPCQTMGQVKKIIASAGIMEMKEIIIDADPYNVL